jgi:hypothetical protein
MGQSTIYLFWAFIIHLLGFSGEAAKAVTLEADLLLLGENLHARRYTARLNTARLPAAGTLVRPDDR